MKKLFIFDLDGTLVNSIYDLADSMNAVLEKHGFPTHETEAYKYFVGDGTLKLVERTLPESERTEEKIRAVHEEFSLEYNNRAVDKTRPYEGIVQLIKYLRDNGALTAVASNKPDKFVRFIVETLFEENMFDYVAGKREGVPTKPAPDILYGIMRELDVGREQSVLVGDSNVDVLTAHNAGMECIGCSWGFRGRKELEEAGAEFVIDSPLELTEIYK